MKIYYYSQRNATLMPTLFATVSR